MASTDPLSRFDPLTAEWFRGRLGTPTAIQVRAWQSIERGEHILMAAPTGSGKTLAAFLWALDRLIAGQWPPDATRVLYVSPLKALNNDIQRNLLGPLQELRALFLQRGRPFPGIQVRVRSGDTAPAERRRLLRRPPEILITTPESLHLMLSSAGGLATLGELRTVILDEIHAVLESRRGTLLITGVERLTRLSGEFQRIALSATLNPLETAARFVGGFRLLGPPDQPRYAPRPVRPVAASPSKRYELTIRQPGSSGDLQDNRDYWVPFAEALMARIQANRSTLIFTNSRRLCEKLTFLINKAAQRLLAYAHHGSLSREIRAEVEKNLKDGTLRAIVATSSLELGIDIGALDEVILVQSPHSVAETVQRVGRAGHGVGQVSRGTFFPSHVLDQVSAAVMVRAVAEECIEALRPIRAALDVLAQVVLSMTALETWRCDDLYHFMRTAWPYHDLSRRQFDLVLEMLAGRYNQSRIRELQARIHYDRLIGSVRTTPGALLALYASGGVIPDRGYYTLRHGQSGARIGELDEEFVWEARIGQVFTLGTQNWRIRKITASDVLVVPAAHARSAPPFWKAEAGDRGFHLADRIGRWLEWAEGRLFDPDFTEELIGEHCMDAAAARRLIEQLQRQRDVTACALPHRHHVVVEATHLSAGGGRLLVWHTVWGGRVNRPLAMALEAAMEERYGSAPQIFATNEAVCMLLPGEVRVEEVISLVPAERVEELVRRRLPHTGYFGARFRECAGRALLLPRRRFNARNPLWLSRLRAQQLMEAVGADADFPILLETWRTCLQESFDLTTLKMLLNELADGSITLSLAQTPFPSPLARSSAWQPVNTFMYLGDAPAAPRQGGLTEELLREIALQPGLRPHIDPATVQAFEAKRQRLMPGYAPDSAEELLEWLKERLAIPLSEWQALLAAVDRDHDLDSGTLTAVLGEKAIVLHCGPEGKACREPLVMALEMVSRWQAAFCDQKDHLRISDLSGAPVALNSRLPTLDAACEEDHVRTGSWLGEWLRFYGPRSQTEVAAILGLSPERCGILAAQLLAAQEAVFGQLVEGGAADEICDRINFEILLRLTRQAAAPRVATLPADRLPLFLAGYQGLTRTGDSLENLAERLNQLLYLPAPAALWEGEILPARLARYRIEWLDQLMQEDQLRWIGFAGRKVLFGLAGELDLIEPLVVETEPGRSEGDGATEAEAADLFPDTRGRYPLTVLQQHSALSAEKLNARLWRAVWQGRVSNDTFAALRRGLETGFKVSAPVVGSPATAVSHRFQRRAAGRAAFQRWRNTRPSVGNWFRVDRAPSPQDPLEAEELKKERVRLLLERYGILFRELLQRELPVLRWPALFRTLRLMELSGEVLAGHFFEGIAGLQFIAPQVLPRLMEDLPDAIYWINAADPASLCGSGIPALSRQLPKRLPGTHLVYHGTQLVLVSRQQARHLAIRVPCDHPNLKAYFGFLSHLLSRPVSPLRSIGIETINDSPASRHEGFIEVLKEMFETVVDPKGVSLYLRPHP